MSEVCATPKVRRTASRLGVNLAAVSGSGVGGRITTADVIAAAPPRPRAALPAAVPRGLATEERQSVWDGKRVAVDPYARNPLVDEFRQANPFIYQKAAAGGPPPTLFSAGDLPLFTGSGNAPAALLRLPWKARHPAARADQAAWAEMFEQLGNDGTREDAIRKADRADWTYGNDSGNNAYKARVSEWASTSGIPDYNDPEVVRQAMKAMAKQDAADKAARDAKRAEAARLSAEAQKSTAKAAQLSREADRPR